MTAPFHPGRFDHVLLLTRAGEIAQTFIAQAALARARHRYGADCRPADIAYERAKLTGWAQILRARFRAAHGLADDQTYTMIAPFGRQRDGLRRSAF